MSVAVPHSFLRADGFKVQGTRRVSLCSHCDRNKPAAQALIDQLLRCEELALNDHAVLAACWQDWLIEVLPAEIDDDQLAECLHDW
ncbi:hypothetical protein Ntsu_32100 [Nocardia sp. IFM 10818]